MIPSSLRGSFLPAPWRIALTGAFASLPAGIALNWLPRTEVTVSGSILIVGAVIGGAMARKRSIDSGAVGARVGIIAALTEIGQTIIIGGALAAVAPASRRIFFALASIAVLFLAPLFGFASGRVGGWIASFIADS